MPLINTPDALETLVNRALKRALCGQWTRNLSGSKPIIRAWALYRWDFQKMIAT